MRWCPRCGRWFVLAFGYVRPFVAVPARGPVPDDIPTECCPSCTRTSSGYTHTSEGEPKTATGRCQACGGEHREPDPFA